MERTVTPFYTPGYVLLPFNIALLIKSDVCHECGDEQKSTPRLFHSQMLDQLATMNLLVSQAVYLLHILQVCG